MKLNVVLQISVEELNVILGLHIIVIVHCALIYGQRKCITIICVTNVTRATAIINHTYAYEDN